MKLTAQKVPVKSWVSSCESNSDQRKLSIFLEEASTALCKLWLGQLPHRLTHNFSFAPPSKLEALQTFLYKFVLWMCKRPHSQRQRMKVVCLEQVVRLRQGQFHFLNSDRPLKADLTQSSPSSFLFLCSGSRLAAWINCPKPLGLNPLHRFNRAKGGDNFMGRRLRFCLAQDWTQNSFSGLRFTGTCCGIISTWNATCPRQ